MKITVTLKDPDALVDAVRDACNRIVIDGVSDEELAEIRASRAETAEQDIKHKWMEYGEYLVVEFDTDTGFTGWSRRAQFQPLQDAWIEAIADRRLAEQATTPIVETVVC